jgi:hypothetical protein
MTLEKYMLRPGGTSTNGSQTAPHTEAIESLRSVARTIIHPYRSHRNIFLDLVKLSVPVSAIGFPLPEACKQ